MLADWFLLYELQTKNYPPEKLPRGTMEGCEKAKVTIVNVMVFKRMTG